MVSESFLDLHKVSVGKRYVFFKSLLNVKEPVTSLYGEYYNIGQAYVNKAAAALHPNINNIEGLEKIKNYIQMIGELAENERNNEVAFVEKFVSIINQDSTGELQEHFSTFIKMENGFNYIQLIALINELLKNKNDLEQKRAEIVNNNMNLMQKNFQNASEDLQDKMQESFIDNYGVFSLLANKHLITPITKTLEDGTEQIQQKYNTSIPSLLSSKLNSILNTIVNNPDYLQLIKNAWINSQWNKNSKTFVDYTVASIMKYLTSLEYDVIKSSKAEDLASRVIKNLDSILDSGMQNLTSEYVENLANVMGKRVEKSFEEIALTTHRNLAQMFVSLTAAEKEGILRRYKNYGLSREKVRELSAKITNNIESSKKEKEQLTKMFVEAVTKMAKKKFGSAIEKTKDMTNKEYNKIIANLAKEKKDFFKTREFKDDIKNNLSIKTDGPSLAEFLASSELEQALQASIYVPGKKILLKTDASFTITLNDIDFKNEELNEDVSDLMNNFGKNFLSAYKEAGEGATNVAEAKKVYINLLSNIKETVTNGLQDTNLSDDEKKDLLKQLNDFVLGSISVKEYAMGTNEFGFHGGSLGPNVEAIINNINEMYDAGGISSVDADILYFSVINCAEAAIGLDLKDDLTTYLLGGAAMMMFDDGFASTTNFMEKMINQFGFSPKLLHLYVLQGKYIPASYIYTTIYNRLIEAYGDLSSEVYTTISAGATSSTNVNIINNLSEKDIHTWNESGWHHAQKRWDDISEQALNKVEITFIFMAGILDIFESLTNAFINP